VAVAHRRHEARVEHGVTVEDEDALAGDEPARNDLVDAVRLRHGSVVLHDRDGGAAREPPPPAHAGGHGAPAAARHRRVASLRERRGHHAGRAVAASVDADDDLVHRHALFEQRCQRTCGAGLLVEHGHHGGDPVGTAHRQRAVRKQAEDRVEQRDRHQWDAGHLGHG